MFDHQSRKKEKGTAFKNESDTFTYVVIIKYFLSFNLMFLNGTIKNIISSSFSLMWGNINLSPVLVVFLKVPTTITLSL